MAYEDTTPNPLQIEQRMIQGVAQTHVNALLKRLRNVVISEQVPHAAVRAIVKLGTSAEPGSVFFGTFKKRALEVELRSKRNILDIDEDLQAYYGNIRPGLQELRVAGMDESVISYWLEFFRKDNGIYRVYVTAAMCIAGAARDTA